MIMLIKLTYSLKLILWKMKFMWVIWLPIKLMCLPCSLTYRYITFLCEMGCQLSTPETEETRKLTDHFKKRNTLDKHLEKIGKTLIIQLNGRGVSRVVQEQFEISLYSVDQAHQYLIDLLKPYLPNKGLTKICINEKQKKEIENLNRENAELKTENLLQREKYEAIIKGKTQEFHEEKRKWKEDYANLKRRSQLLEKEREEFTNNVVLSSTVISQQIGNSEAIYKRKQQQFEETLKIQNDLIDNLKYQISQYQTESKNLKAPNFDLTKKQVSYQYYDETPLVQRNTIQFENERKKSREQQNADQNHLKELQEIQQELKNKNQILEINLFQSDQQLQKLHRENKTLLQQISETRENYKSREDLIGQLEQRLSKLIDERDMWEMQSIGLQKNIQEQTTLIKNLNIEILYLQNEIKRLSAELHHTKTKEEESQLGEAGVVRPNKNQKDADNFADSNLLDKTPSDSREEPTAVEENAYVRESLGKIEQIHLDTEALEGEVRNFSGTEEDKTFLHLKELLIRNVVKLDNVETEGYFIIRKKRKEVIQHVQKLLDILKDNVI